MLSPSDSIFTVILLIAGPGSYFDLAGSIFQVPDCVSAAATGTFSARATSSSVVANAANVFIRIIYPPWWDMAGEDCAVFMCPSWRKVQRILADSHRGSCPREKFSDWPREVRLPEIWLTSTHFSGFRVYQACGSRPGAP